MDSSIAALVFFATLALTFGAAVLARFHADPKSDEEDLAGRRLNKWMIGLSAGTAANSGFIVTGAVGLGYAGGVHWLLLPISWLLGDLVYWWLFPDRLNALARKAKAATLSEVLTFDMSGRWSRLIAVAVSVILVIFLATYTSAQWLAGKKFLSGTFLLTDYNALLLFAVSIVAYTALGGFRGSVYTDVLQAVVRVLGTIIALAAVAWYAFHHPTFSQNIAQAGDDFLSLLPAGGLVTAICFIAGYASAAIGFGLGQPQIVSRYFAGSSPQETRSAWWIYIGFVQFTWLAMTGFGILLRGVTPGISDPETGLSLFFQQNMGAILTGIILADVYATIAGTSNAILVAISQSIMRDLWPATTTDRRWIGTLMIVLVGFITIALSIVIPGNVFSIALFSVAMIASGLAGPMIIKVFGWAHSGASMFFAIVTGFLAAFLWKLSGLGGVFNEAGVGIACSLLVNWVIVRSSSPVLRPT